MTIARLCVFSLAAVALACGTETAVPGAASAGQSSGGNAGAAGATYGAPASGGALVSGGTASGGDPTGGSADAAGSSAGGISGGGQGGSSGEPAKDPTGPLPSPGCNGATPLADGAAKLTVGALERSFVVRKPRGYEAKKPYPLVLALHPNGSGSGYWDGTSGSRAVRPLLEDEAVLILPQARDNDWRGDVPLDLGYFDALLTEVEAKLCVDMRRITSMGFSGGGSFSGVLGCYRRDIRAIAVGGSVIYFEEADCIGKPAAWITIGDDEAVQARLDYRDFFRTSAGCQATSRNVEPSPCVAYDCPSPERPVTFCRHIGGHEWPDFGSKAAVDFLLGF